MSINYTPEQQKVIELHNRNILVSAAAGSGKTAVLVERIIRMVCDESHPVDIDRLLIVTFTNAAAAEMRERIAAGIAEQLRVHPESEHIQKQSTLLHNAQITTIDSFSLFIIRNHFNEIGLDPAFRVADQGEIRLLQQDVLQEMLEDAHGGQGDAFAGREDAFHACVEIFCPGGRESVLEQHILNLSRYAASLPWPEEWLKKRREDYSADNKNALLESDYGEYLQRHIRHMTEGCIQKMMQVKKLCESPDGPYMYGEMTEREMEQLMRLAESVSLEEYARRLPAVSFGRLPSKKDESVSHLKREMAKKLRNEVKDTLQGMEEKFFATPLELAVAQGRECVEPVSTLIDLVVEFNRRMKERKQQKKLIDFSDMEHYALDILLKRDEESGGITPSPVALEYRQYFHEVLIDEYQDSNLVQEYLLKAVSGEEDGNFNRFMVGDVKQSIYKFRLARPELFLEKYNTYDTEEKKGECLRIDLSRNFRSRTQVVDTVNQVFFRLMSSRTGGIAYDDRAALYAGASYPENEGCESELILVEKPEKVMKPEKTMGLEKTMEPGITGRALNSKQAEALAIAHRMKELHASFRVTDKESGELKPASYGDMVILLRTNSGWDEEFKKVLEDEGIPVHITSKTGYFAAPEVQELLQFLRVLDNPYQDIPLFGVMKSVLGGFDQEEIALLRGYKKGCFLYEALCAYGDWELAGDRETGENLVSESGGNPAQRIDKDAAQCADESMVQGGDEGRRQDAVKNAEPDDDVQQERDSSLMGKCRDFLAAIDSYRDATVYLPIRELLQRIVKDFHYLDYVTALPAGSRRRANVEMLFTKASDFEKTSYFGLFHFVRYMEQLEKYDVDYGEADTMDENADVVRIMSIHKSKGLEFPIVFVAGLSKRFNMQDVNQSMIVDMDLGIACDYVNPARRIRNKTLRRIVLSRKMREDSLAEELRVLYVALTRAREKLIMTAALEKAAEEWELARERQNEHLSYIDFMEAGSYMDFLMPILSQTDLAVSVTDGADLLGEEVKEQIQLYDRKAMLEQAGDYADKTELDRLRERFAYEYPYKNMEKLYTKTTVSELKIAAMAAKDEAAYHTFEEKEVVPYIPAFRRGEERVSGTVRGNAFHRAMELLDFEAVLEGQFAAFPETYQEYCGGLDVAALAEKLHAFLKKEVEELRLSEEYFHALQERKLVHFLEKEIAYRMWAADRRGELYREQPFVLGIDAGRLLEEFPSSEKVLIQGIIDVFFIENGALVLLDYKTDVIPSMEALWNRYGVQLDYYEEALTRLMQMPMKEKKLYSFYLEEV